MLYLNEILKRLSLLHVASIVFLKIFTYDTLFLPLNVIMNQMITITSGFYLQNFSKIDVRNMITLLGKQ
jgi:hypothetical protein